MVQNKKEKTEIIAIKSSTFPREGLSKVSEPERACEASSVQQVNEWAVRAKEQTDELVSQYCSFDSWLFWPTVTRWIAKKGIEPASTSYPISLIATNRHNQKTGQWTQSFFFLVIISSHVLSHMLSHDLCISLIISSAAKSYFLVMKCLLPCFSRYRLFSTRNTLFVIIYLPVIERKLLHLRNHYQRPGTR